MDDARQDTQFQQLIARLIDRDKSALDELLQSYLPKITSFLRVRMKRAGLHGRDYTEDRAQSFAVLFLDHWNKGDLDRHLKQMSEPGDLLRLLTAMATGRFVDWQRRATAACRTPTREDGSVAPSELATRQSNENALADQEVTGQMLDAMDETTRRIFELHLDGLSFVEISSEVGIGADAVRKRYHRWCAELREMFGDAD